MRKRTRARECALQILYAMDITKEGYSEAVNDYWQRELEAATEKSIREFAELIVRGVSENISAIDEVIAKYATNWQINRMATVDRNILRIATYEILYLDDIPPKVSINEAVEMAKRFGDSDSGKFVNGVMDKICKTCAKEKLEKEKSNEPTKTS